MDGFPKLMWLMIFSAVLMLGPDMVRIAGFTWHAHDIAEYATEQMSAGGGWTPTVQTLVEERMSELGIDPNHWVIRHTDGPVSGHGDVYFSIETKYMVRAYAMLGRPVAEALGDTTLVKISANSETGTQIY
ncbi:hypothetical protein L2089_15730 [Paenibacillus hunanensis]|uniref:hypothetical protein n=1 Tax=Paenibacillus hunanensis TaxID=539262 RepID=UPI002026794A|nr:hypothetical protein [Paenibacillus hunanensis]MCL9662144.1 hypothetical protein [Paenibacillus hunanensis]